MPAPLYGLLALAVVALTVVVVARRRQVQGGFQPGTRRPDLRCRRRPRPALKNARAQLPDRALSHDEIACAGAAARSAPAAHRGEERIARLGQLLAARNRTIPAPEKTRLAGTPRRTSSAFAGAVSVAQERRQRQHAVAVRLASRPAHRAPRIWATHKPAPASPPSPRIRRDRARSRIPPASAPRTAPAPWACARDRRDLRPAPSACRREFSWGVALGQQPQHRADHRQRRQRRGRSAGTAPPAALGVRPRKSPRMLVDPRPPHQPQRVAGLQGGGVAAGSRAAHRGRDGARAGGSSPPAQTSFRPAVATR